jgi:hypothetical protein
MLVLLSLALVLVHEVPLLFLFSLFCPASKKSMKIKDSPVLSYWPSGLGATVVMLVLGFVGFLTGDKIKDSGSLLRENYSSLNPGGKEPKPINNLEVKTN